MTEYIINTLVFLFTCVPTSFDVFIMSKKRLSDAKTLIFNVFKHLKRNQYLLLVNLFQYIILQTENGKMYKYTNKRAQTHTHTKNLLLKRRNRQISSFVFFKTQFSACVYHWP